MYAFPLHIRYDICNYLLIMIPIHATRCAILEVLIFH